MNRFDDLLSDFKEMNGQYISTKMHRIRASVVQVVHAFHTNPPEQTLPILRTFDKRQLRWKNRLIPDISFVPAQALKQTSLDWEDIGALIISVREFIVPDYVE